MRQIETSYRAVPVGRNAGARFSRAARPDFLGELIADRQTLAAQRQQRRASTLEVLRTYDANGRRAILRLPAGWVLDIEA
ncbi:MAG: hypothetical protein EOP22_19195 [Hyphomicrobiales bacterium]|nr:MAG: hypothetical protein EOP22_19195 [Hyphomicrobiales bacterium]